MATNNYNKYNKQAITTTSNKDSKKLSEILASDAIKSLAVDLKLTPRQIMKANTAALGFQSDEKLKACNQYSLVKYCYYAASFDFAHPTAVYPVPYDGQVQFQIGYQGLRELCMRTNKYRIVDAVEVLDCDKVYRDEDGQYRVKFESDEEKTKDAKVKGYFAFARYKDGTYAGTRYWTDEKVEEHALTYSVAYKSYKAGKSKFESPWCNKMQRPKMAMKTVLKDLCRNLDMSPLMEEAIKQDQIVYGGLNKPDTYADNPKNVESFDFSNEETKSTTTNSILPPQEEEAPAIEQPKPKVETAPKKEPVQAKKQDLFPEDPLEGIIEEC